MWEDAIEALDADYEIAKEFWFSTLAELSYELSIRKRPYAKALENRVAFACKIFGIHNTLTRRSFARFESRDIDALFEQYLEDYIEALDRCDLNLFVADLLDDPPSEVVASRRKSIQIQRLLADNLKASLENYWMITPRGGPIGTRLE